LRNLADALLVNKAPHDYQSLICGQAIDKLEEHGAMFYFCCFISPGFVLYLRFICRDFKPAGCALPSISQSVSGNPQQPRRKRNAAPLEATNVAKRLVKDLCRYVLRFIAAAHSPRNKGVHAMEITFIKLSEPAGIALRGFNQTPLVIQIG
jgi:hypothetical protein